MVPKETQVKALDAILRCIDPSVLVLPDKLLQLIPPRPASYEYNRELFRKRTGLVFDALSPAETAADLPLSFLFNAERLSRMEEQAVAGGLSVAELTEKIIGQTFRAKRRSGMEGLIQQQNEQLVLTYLLAGSVNEQLNMAARSSLVRALELLKKDIVRWSAATADQHLKGHYALALLRMKEPEKAKPTVHAVIPPGAPIGCDNN